MFEKLYSSSSSPEDKAVWINLKELIPTAKNENILRPNNINKVAFEISNSPKLIEIKKRLSIFINLGMMIKPS